MLGWIGAFLARDRNLILVKALVLLVLTVIFAGTMANFLEGMSALYRIIEGVGR